MKNIQTETNFKSPLGDLGVIIDETNLVPLQGLEVFNSPSGVGGRREDLQFLPISINVTNKKILLVGGGKVATHKGSIMARFVQNVTVISPEFTDEIKQLPFTFIEKEYEKSDLEGFFLIYVCTGNHELNAQIKVDAEELGILTSVCDAPLLCDFVSPAIHKEDNVTISVGTNARDAFQAVYIRNQITELVKNGTIQINKPA